MLTKEEKKPSTNQNGGSEASSNAAATWKMNHHGDGAIMFPEDLEKWFEKVREGTESPYNEIKGNAMHIQ